MANKNEFIRRFNRAISLDDNDAFCAYLDTIKKDKDLMRFLSSENFLSEKLDLLETGRSIIGIKIPLDSKNENMYRNTLKKLHDEILIEKDDEQLKSRSLRSKITIALTIVLIVIGTIAIWLVLYPPPKHPDIVISQTWMSHVYIRGQNYTTMPTLDFAATPEGERSVRGDINFTILFLNQTSNSCENATFFYTREICQYNATSDSVPYHKSCGLVSIAPLTLNSPTLYVSVTQDIINHEIKSFINETKNKNIPSCRINETIEVCASYECSGIPAYECRKNCSGILMK